MPLPKLPFLCLLAVAAQAQQYTKTVFAGGGPPDNIPATSISVGAWGIAMDGSGNLYIAGGTLYRVFKVTPAGIASTYAGNGRRGLTDGLATNGSFSSLLDIAIDSAGNAYIADAAALRKIGPDGLLTTVHPTANTETFMGVHGVAVDSSGNVYVADQLTHRIHKFAPNGTRSTFAGIADTPGFSGDNGLATNAKLYNPIGVAADRSGNVYIADTQNCRVRKVTPAGIITTIAGNGQAGFAGDGGLAVNARLAYPVRLAVDNGQNVYISDRSSQRIRRVDSAGIISTVAGGGIDPHDGIAAANASIDGVASLLADSSGNLYIGDSGNGRVRKISPDGRISTVAGGGPAGDGGPATSAQLNTPVGLTIDGAGNVLIADLWHYRVRKVTAAGTISTLAGNGRSLQRQPAYIGSLYTPAGTAVDSTGNVFIADCTTIRKLTPDGVMTTIAGTGEVGDSSGDGGPALNARLGCANSIAIDRAGNLYITTDGGGRLRRVTAQGIITTVAGKGAYGFSGDGGPAVDAMVSRIQRVAVDRHGNIFLADTGNNRIRKISLAGIISTVAGGGPWGQPGDGGPATGAHVEQPASVAVDSFGHLYLAEPLRIRRVTPDGIISTVIDQIVSEPWFQALALDGAGNLFACTEGDNRVWKFTPTSPTPTVQPAALTFAAATEDPPARTLTVTNAIAAIVTSGDFLVVTPKPGGFSVAVTSTGLAPGAYSGNVRVGGTGPSVDVPVTLCVYSASSVFPQLNATGGEGSISIATGAGCGWTLTTTAAWIDGATTGSGSASQTLQIAANAGSARSAEVTVTANGTQIATFTVTQSGATDPPQSAGLRFVPVTPCRVADTRNTTRLESGETRAFAMTPCGIPTAAAYSLNVTVVPAGPLSYLTLWPAAQPRPLVSTLNSFEGTTRANAAIVPAGANGQISVFATDPTNVILDINGYFIAPQ